MSEAAGKLRENKQFIGVDAYRVEAHPFIGLQLLYITFIHADSGLIFAEGASEGIPSYQYCYIGFTGLSNVL